MSVLCASAAVTEDRVLLVRLGPTQSVILLRLHGGEVLAWRNACPHMGIELDWEPSRLLTRDGRYIRCTGHGALFRKDNGLCVRGPCAGEALQSVPIRMDGDRVALDE